MFFVCYAVRVFDCLLADCSLLIVVFLSVGWVLLVVCSVVCSCVCLLSVVC